MLVKTTELVTNKGTYKLQELRKLNSVWNFGRGMLNSFFRSELSKYQDFTKNVWQAFESLVLWEYSTYRTDVRLDYQKWRALLVYGVHLFAACCFMVMRQNINNDASKDSPYMYWSCIFVSNVALLVIGLGSVKTTCAVMIILTNTNYWNMYSCGRLKISF